MTIRPFILPSMALFVLAAAGWGAEPASPPRLPVPETGAPVTVAPVAPGALQHPQGPTCHAGPCEEMCSPCEEAFCGPPGRFWVTGDYLLWWTRQSPLPPLVTTSPAGTPRGQAGILGAPGTTVLFGGDGFGSDARSGWRVGAGFWLNRAQTLGVEGSFFALEQESTAFQAASSGNPILARPFFNAQSGRPDSVLIAFPGVVNGDVNVAGQSTGLFGAEANLRCNLCCGCCYRVDGLLGYRFLGLDDGFQLVETEINRDPTQPFPVGTRITIGDSFDTNNRFHGGQVGLAGEYRRGRFFVQATGKVAVGATRKVVEIAGSSTSSEPGEAPDVRRGAFLAQPTNIGRFTATDFAVVPEIGFNLGYQVTDCLRVRAGYTFLYWSDVARAGDQVDLTVNPTQIPPGQLIGAPRPAFSFKDTDFWAQGLNFGIELRF